MTTLGRITKRYEIEKACVHASDRSTNWARIMSLPAQIQQVFLLAVMLCSIPVRSRKGNRNVSLGEVRTRGMMVDRDQRSNSGRVV